MQRDLTELIFIIDASGSMKRLAESTIDGFNAVIDAQRLTPGEKKISVILFNQDSEALYEQAPISDVLPLTEDDYNPHGKTALLDALQGMINDTGNRHYACGEKDLPENTIFFITTDGQENASRWATEESVKGSIEYHTEHDGWQFVFLAANLDAIETAARYGIDSRHAARYYDDEHGTNLKFRAMNRYIENVIYKAEDNNWADELDADYESRK